MQLQQLVLLLIATAAVVESAPRTVLLTGATGRSGVHAYSELKKLGFTLRALVRNATKAKERLGCTKCDETEGIFIGDLTKPETLTASMQGVDVLVVAAGPVTAHCLFGPFGCKWAEGATPKEILFDGLKSTVGAFLNTSGTPIEDRHVVLLSGGQTTVPDSFTDKIGNGHSTFYSLVGESFLMGAGVPYTIVKACGLGDGDGGKRRMIVGHDDNISAMMMIPRGDVGRVLAAAAAFPDLSKGTRFDLCVAPFGKPTEYVTELFQEAMFDWDPRKHATSTMVV